MEDVSVGMPRAAFSSESVNPTPSTSSGITHLPVAKKSAPVPVSQGELPASVTPSRSQRPETATPKQSQRVPPSTPTPATQAGEAGDGDRSSRKGKPKGSYWDDSLNMTKELRVVQKSEAEILVEVAELKRRKIQQELEISDLHFAREFESLESERKRRKWDESRAQMMYEMCAKEYKQKMGFDFDKVLNYNLILNSIGVKHFVYLHSGRGGRLAGNWGHYRKFGALSDLYGHCRIPAGIAGNLEASLLFSRVHRNACITTETSI